MPAAPRSRRLRLTLIGVGAVALLPVGLSPAVAQDPAPAVSATVVGKVVRAWADPKTPSHAPKAEGAKPLTWIEPAKGDAVRVPTDQAAKLPLGSTVKVSVGDEVTDVPAAEAGLDPAREVLAAKVITAAPAAPALPATAPYTNTVTVVAVHPAGDTTVDATTAADVVADVNGPVADFWESQSRGAIKLHAEAATTVATDPGGWYTAGVGCADATALWNDVANHTGWTAGPGKHLLLYLPNGIPDPDCEYGWGELGTGITSGGRMYVTDSITSVLAHELGHNFGLGHSSELECDMSIDTGSDCGVASYMDLYDVMGASWDQVGSLSAPQADLLGVLAPGEVSDLEGTHGTRDVSLAPISGSTGTRAIRLGANDGNVYWLEYRAAAGQDSWLGDPAKNEWDLQTGVSIRIEDNSDDTSLLLDATPSGPAGWEDDFASALASGRSVWLSGLDYYVTVKSATSTGAVVRVQAGDGAVPRDLNRNYLPDLTVADSAGNLFLYPANGHGGFSPRSTIGKGWQTRDAIVMAGDFDGTGNSQDLIARDPKNGDLWLYSGNGKGGFTGSKVIGRGWSVMNAIFSPGDWNGDGLVDLIARRRDDASLWLYPGNGSGGFKTATKIGSGWASITALAATGDFDLNGTPDFVARGSDGTLYLYQGNGKGGFGTRVILGHGWQILTALTGVGDWNDDGAADLLGRKSDGSFWLYPGRGDGGFLTAQKIGSGWSSVRIAS